MIICASMHDFSDDPSDKHIPQGPNELYRELEILGTISHRHIVRLYGWCQEVWTALTHKTFFVSTNSDKNETHMFSCSTYGMWHIYTHSLNECSFTGCLYSHLQVPCLVFELCENGSLDTCLPKLHWDDRVRVATEVCRALIFLHTRYRAPQVWYDVMLAMYSSSTVESSLFNVPCLRVQHQTLQWIKSITVKDHCMGKHLDRVGALSQNRFPFLAWCPQHGSNPNAEHVQPRSACTIELGLMKQQLALHWGCVL